MGRECQTSGHACSAPLERLPKYLDHLAWKKENNIARNEKGQWQNNNSNVYKNYNCVKEWQYHLK